MQSIAISRSGSQRRRALMETDSRAGAARWAAVVLPALVYLGFRWLLRACRVPLWAEAAGMAALCAAFAAVCCRKFPPEPLSGRKVLRILLYGAAGLAAGALLCLLPRGETPDPSAAAVLLLCILGPACEEAVYRGLVFGAAEKLCGWIPALLVSAALFACGHAAPLQAAAAVPVGLVLGMIRKKEGNLLAPAAFHAALNAAALLF